MTRSFSVGKTIFNNIQTTFPGQGLWGILHNYIYWYTNNLCPSKRSLFDSYWFSKMQLRYNISCNLKLVLYMTPIADKKNSSISKNIEFKTCSNRSTEWTLQSTRRRVFKCEMLKLCYIVINVSKTIIIYPAVSTKHVCINSHHAGPPYLICLPFWMTLSLTTSILHNTVSISRFSFQHPSLELSCPFFSKSRKTELISNFLHTNFCYPSDTFIVNVHSMSGYVLARHYKMSRNTIRKYAELQTILQTTLNSLKLPLAHFLFKSSLLRSSRKHLKK